MDPKSPMPKRMTLLQVRALAAIVSRHIVYNAKARVCVLAGASRKLGLHVAHDDTVDGMLAGQWALDEERLANRAHQFALARYQLHGKNGSPT